MIHSLYSYFIRAHTLAHAHREKRAKEKLMLLNWQITTITLTERDSSLHISYKWDFSFCLRIWNSNEMFIAFNPIVSVEMVVTSHTALNRKMHEYFCEWMSVGVCMCACHYMRTSLSRVSRRMELCWLCMHICARMCTCRTNKKIEEETKTAWRTNKNPWKFLSLQLNSFYFDSHSDFTICVIEDDCVNDNQ